MPRLPQATDLNGVSPQAARSFVDQPVPDYAAGFSAVAGAVKDVGAGIDAFASAKIERQRKQERFDTKMALIGAEEAYANSVKDLDPLDPEYVEKKRTARRETFKPVLENVKDPDNRQFFEESTYADYVNEGLKAESAHKTARGKKQVLDLGTYVDTVRRGLKDKTYTGDPIADITQMVNDTELDEVTKQEILPELLKGVNSDQFDMDFEAFTTGGISVTPSVRAAVTKAVANAGPGAPSYLENYLLRVAMVESNGGRTKVNPRNPGVGGTWQVAEKTAPDLGLSLEDRFDDDKSAVGIAGMAMRDYKMLAKKLGREPTPAELYLAHQQGIGGGPALLLADPGAKAASLVGKKAVEDNLPDSMQHLTDTITAKQFADHIMSTFNGTSGGGMIDANTTLEALRSTESYQRMGPDEQTAAEKGVITAIDKQNTEAKKSADINTARNAANQAGGEASTLAEGYRWIDENVPDPETREKARTMFKAEFEANEKGREAQYDAGLDQVYANVANAINSGDIGAALAAIPIDGLNRKDRDDLEKRIADGPIQIDDPRDLERINDLKYSRNPDDQKAFAKLELNRFRLSDATREKIFKDQQSVAKEIEQTGSAPSLAEPSKMLSDRLFEIGIDTSSAVKNKTTLQTNLRLERQIKSILDQNLKLATDRAGRKLLPDEIQRVMDQTFMDFSRTKRVDGWFEDYDVVNRQGLPDVFAMFEEKLEPIANASRAKDGQPPLAPGELLQMAIDARTREYADAKEIVARDMRALMSRARSPQARIQGDLETEYAWLQRMQQELENFRIDAEDLYLWAERTFKKEEE